MELDQIIIDDEFQELLCPLDDETLAGLEASLKADGCINPLVVWADRNILLDGHNRHEICMRLGIDAEIREVILTDRVSAADWIDANQANRRNLTPDQMSLVRGRRYNRLKKADGVRGTQKLDQNDPASTADRLAREHGVSAPTIKRDGQYAAAVEALKEVAPELPKQIAAGKAPAKRQVIAAAKEPQRAKEILDQPKKIMSREEYEAGECHDVPKRRGIGVQRAHEAIAVLKRIPQNDALRGEGLDIVSRWIKANK